MEESRRSIDPTTKDEGIKNGFRSVKLTCVYSYRGGGGETRRRASLSIRQAVVQMVELIGQKLWNIWVSESEKTRQHRASYGSDVIRIIGVATR